MIGTQTPPHEQGREYDRYASASVRELDVDGSPIVAVMIDEDSAGVKRVELRREDVWVIRRDRDEVVRWTRPGGDRIVSGVPEWGYLVLEELGLAGDGGLMAAPGAVLNLQSWGQCSSLLVKTGRPDGEEVL